MVRSIFVTEFTEPERQAMVLLYRFLAAPLFLRPEVWLEPAQQGPLHLALAAWCYPAPSLGQVSWCPSYL